MASKLIRLELVGLLPLVSLRYPPAWGDGVLKRICLEAQVNYEILLKLGCVTFWPLGISRRNCVVSS